MLRDLAGGAGTVTDLNAAIGSAAYAGESREDAKWNYNRNVSRTSTSAITRH